VSTPFLLAQSNPNLGLLSDQDTALLVVAALLCMWLWLLVRRREEAPEYKRPTPLSRKELGRMIFQAARSRDLRTWRALFLNGAEAAERLGSQAESWIAAHSVPHMTATLDAIAQSLPPGVIYVDCVETEDGRCALKLKQPEGEEFLVAIGQAEQVGVAWRMFGVG